MNSERWIYRWDIQCWENVNSFFGRLYDHLTWLVWRLESINWKSLSHRSLISFIRYQGIISLIVFLFVILEESSTHLYIWLIRYKFYILWMVLILFFLNSCFYITYFFIVSLNLRRRNMRMREHKIAVLITREILYG